MSSIISSYSTMQLTFAAIFTLVLAFCIALHFLAVKGNKIIEIAKKLDVAVDKIHVVWPGTDLVQKGYDECIKKGLDTLILMKGDHIMTKRLSIEHPIYIIGAGRDQTFVKGGGFWIKGKKEERYGISHSVVLKDFSLIETSVYYPALCAYDGLSFLCKDMYFILGGNYAVSAYNTKGRLINCEITMCREGGIGCGKNALIELEGSRTKVDGNCTSDSSRSYGLSTSDTSSRIHLLFPLTKESVSTNNNGGRNYGSDCSGGGTIKTVKSF